METKGYLQHKASPTGPFKTESVTAIHIHNEYGDRWLAHFEGRWRRVHTQVNKTYIVYQKQKIEIQIDGV